MAVSSLPSSIVPSASSDSVSYRVVLGLGPGRSGTKSLTELLASQRTCVHCEHEMIVPRIYRRDPSGRIDVRSSINDQVDRDNNHKQKKKKGSWGADKRLEWDAPKLARGVAQLTEEEEAMWRTLRLVEQREAFKGWIRDANTAEKNMDADILEERKPRKLGARGWREHNCNTYGNGNACASTLSDSGGKSTKVSQPATHLPVVAAVSSVGLAYVHEYIALDPSIRIVVLMRPREEVVSSFIRKSKGRNHWQRHQSHNVSSSIQKDKTWDSAFPNMSDDECKPFMSGKSSNEVPDKSSAIRAYWELYSDVVLDLAEKYRENVRIFDMAALNDKTVQEDMLSWCRFDDPVLDTSRSVHLNKKKLR